MAAARGALSALHHRNFRRYFVAQVVANIGTWVQITVANRLVLEISHSGLALGITNALQFGPSVLLGMFGGVIADRSDRRRVLIITQACLGLIALVTGVLASFGALTVWTIWLAATVLGLIKCFDLSALAVAASPSMPTMLVAIFAYGVTASLFSVTVISTLQVHTVEAMRGRVMAWYSICFLGSSPLGAPAFGALAGCIGVSGAFFVTASICGFVALVALAAWMLRQPA